MSTPNQRLQQGWRWHQQGQLAYAVDCYQQVLQQHPRHPEAWCYMGIVLYDLKRYADSEQAYRQAIAAHEAFPIAWSNLGNTLSAMGRHREAAEACRRAIALQPDYATAFMNLGSALVKAGEVAEAEEALRQAVALSPTNHAAHRNLSAALVQQGALTEGKASAETALRINPRDAEAHRNLALVRMLNGDWPAAFEEFEWRWRATDMSPPPFPQPWWNGESLAGKTILLHAEQGLGDTLQFVRYAKLVRQQAARVIVQCQSSLTGILAGCQGIDCLINKEQPLPSFDVHCPLMSLPRVFAHTVETVPCETPYLQADPHRVADWRTRLPAAKRRIGVVWQGSRSHRADQHRSVPLAEFAPLAAMDGVRLISLQKGDGVEQLADFPQWNVVDFGEALDAERPFLDTAAVIASVNLVVTIDTSIAHLAGAMHIPTWIALSHAPDWRWLLERTDSVWYPSVRLFRKQRAEPWSAVFGRMAEALAELD